MTDMQTIRAAWDAATRALDEFLASDLALDARHTAAEADGTITDELEAEWDRSGTALGEAEWALFETPAPDLNALEWKIATLRDRGLSFTHDIADRLLADIAIIGGEA